MSRPLPYPARTEPHRAERRILVIRAGEHVPEHARGTWVAVACDDCGVQGRARGRLAAPPSGWRVLATECGTVCTCPRCLRREAAVCEQDLVSWHEVAS